MVIELRGLERRELLQGLQPLAAADGSPGRRPGILVGFAGQEPRGGQAVLWTEHGENVNSSLLFFFCSFWPTQAPRAVELSGPKLKLQIALRAGGWPGVQRDHDQEILNAFRSSI